ncbi:MAG: GNAT family N-acetyltransferase [Ignavibacteriaceae bacterium]|jgi:Acetyltransferases, including N-acetylases of ribosomal proteins|nr:MAG: GNAT family N-acetyltransferase [Chlorobiota bacterium]KXK02546.1 MAG: Mycothiol acetyltransferase [Chlorobi bacterium OLB4]MBV6398138.1 L-amino acid N-acetyltransferase AaaT [Ignavibacteria bacterium]MCC6886587.1 GNAT family N-acetyltransferase [Ignavibacteriales bacterium]MCE7952338.1 GNAT family N-acetyltransferase [Chlorobi bacterium CHB7]MDL1886455.1 GNAT family N-acetyltransferase [Ignavibacteria bacterium CHB1]MEB2329827.1 GNAT family N-acetyltransferase [Ignavibacteriaceae bac
MSKINPIVTVLRDKSELLVRVAEIEDAASLVNIKFDITKEHIYMLREPYEFHNTIDIELKRINDMLHNRNKLQLVAEITNEIVGFLEFETKGIKKSEHVGSIYMGIAEHVRDNGIGTILLNTLIGWAVNNNSIEKITLQVFSNNERAIHLYKKFGFIMEGRLKNDIKLRDGSYIDNICMYKFVN